jgi:hypothetical protein
MATICCTRAPQACQSLTILSLTTASATSTLARTWAIVMRYSTCSTSTRIRGSSNATMRWCAAQCSAVQYQPLALLLLRTLFLSLCTRSLVRARFRLTCCGRESPLSGCVFVYHAWRGLQQGQAYSATRDQRCLTSFYIHCHAAGDIMLDHQQRIVSTMAAVPLSSYGMYVYTSCICDDRSRFVPMVPLERSGAMCAWTALDFTETSYRLPVREGAWG